MKTFGKIFRVSQCRSQEWLSKPVIKVGPIDIPITFIADMILRANERTINREIDLAIGKNLDIKGYAMNLWEKMSEPLLISPEHSLWLRLTPQAIFSSPLQGKSGKLQYTLGIQTLTEALVGERPTVTAKTSLPSLSLTRSPGEEFRVNLLAGISYGRASELARQFIKGQTFRQGRYSLLIRDIDVYAHNDRLIIHLLVSGSLKGDLYLKGVPVFLNESNAIAIKDLDYEIQTRNALAKTGNWLFHSTLVKMIEKNMVFSLNDQIMMAKNQIQEQIKNYPLIEGIALRGTLEELSLGTVSLQSEAITTNVILRGKLVISTR